MWLFTRRSYRGSLVDMVCSDVDSREIGDIGGKNKAGCFCVYLLEIIFCLKLAVLILVILARGRMI